jgi:hypothetical protein
VIIVCAHCAQDMDDADAVPCSTTGEPVHETCPDVEATVRQELA